MSASTRKALSGERILRAAADLLAAEGAGGLSMRRIAEHLEVTPMALYRWFPNKDALVDALAEQLLARPVVVPADGPWIERAVGYATAIRANLTAHLPLLRVDGAARRLTGNLVHCAEDGLRLTLELGYRDGAAVEAFRVLLWTVLDFCLVVDATDALQATSAADGAVRRVADEEGQAFHEDMPILAGLLDFVSTPDPDQFFAATVRAVAHGLEAMAPSGGLGMAHRHAPTWHLDAEQP